MQKLLTPSLIITPWSALVALAKCDGQQRAPAHNRLEIRDTRSPLILRVTERAGRTFIVRARIKGQKQPIRVNYRGPVKEETLEQARAWAGTMVATCSRGEDPRAQASVDVAEAEKAERLEERRFGAIAERFLKRHAAKNRSYRETKRILNFYVLPRWKDWQIERVRRADVAALLDDIEAGTFKAANGRRYGGPVMADAVLGQVRKLMNWYAARDDTYVSPIVKGMARTKPKDRARSRKLSDDEIRALWHALDDLDAEARAQDEGGADVFASIVRVLLLSAQRRDEVGMMVRTELAADGMWEVPPERNKNKLPNRVPLSGLSLQIIAGVPPIDRCDFVFTTNGETPFSGYSKCKRRLDRAMLATLRAVARERADQAVLARVDEIASLLNKADAGDRSATRRLRALWWTFHDLRRTAKTLMIRAGVRPDISERVLNHAINGVEGVYDQHDYVVEKRAALEALAALVERIVQPPTDNVVELARTASG